MHIYIYIYIYVYIHIYTIWSQSSKYDMFCFETKKSFKKHVFWSKKLSYLTPIVWNSLPTDLTLANSLNNFKHKLQDQFFKKIENMEQDIFAY